MSLDKHYKQKMTDDDLNSIDVNNSISNLENQPSLTLEKTKEEEMVEINKDDNDLEYPYSCIPKPQMYFIISLLGSVGLLSTIAGPSLFGCLNDVEKSFNVSAEKVDLLITVYSVVQGVSPSIVSYFVDARFISKRNATILGALVYAWTSFGITQCKDYNGLFALRFFQSFAISPVISINNSVCADLAPKKARGMITGVVGGVQVSLGSAFAPVISAALTERFGSYKAMFYYLFILASSSSILTFFCLPSTDRSDVGNGYKMPSKFYDRAPIIYTKYWKSRVYKKEYPESVVPPKKSSPLLPFIIIKKPEVIALLAASGLQFTQWTVAMTAMSHILANKHYNKSTLEIGKCFLAIGLPTLCSIVGSGRLMNYCYKVQKQKHDLFIEKSINNPDFDPELPKYKLNLYQTRLYYVTPAQVISTACFMVYGWLLNRNEELWVVLLFVGIASLFSNGILPMSTVVIIESHADAGSSAAALLNFGRCELAAIFVAVYTYMVDSWNVGWCFTFLGILTLISSVCLQYVMKKQPYWEYERSLKEKKNVSQEDEISVIEKS
ncbi:uncharacterized protein HGUI_03142 [Hanseniaspora guilliermondii]|uniref:Major facilitator superfamily (MFS) profile domain-containing protein n=1 Tax=Hanseniaspora guilliermondii TaxID=56406 RepID=A0A1L0FN05_9ASCO|nr:uncharacterized protein HGUI_03142 [Hanseniaspora guilliermondii]